MFVSLLVKIAKHKRMHDPFFTGKSQLDKDNLSLAKYMDTIDDNSDIKKLI